MDGRNLASLVKLLAHYASSPKQNGSLELFSLRTLIYLITPLQYHFDQQGARSVMVIVVENGHSNTSSHPRRGWLHFT